MAGASRRGVRRTNRRLSLANAHTQTHKHTHTYMHTHTPEICLAGGFYVCACVGKSQLPDRLSVVRSFSQIGQWVTSLGGKVTRHLPWLQLRPEVKWQVHRGEAFDERSDVYSFLCLPINPALCGIWGARCSGHWVREREREARAREGREVRLRALCPPHGHTLGCIGGG